jgi:type IV secretion system protein VirD4
MAMFAAAAVAALALWTVLASLIFLYGTGLLSSFAVPVWQWWLYALYAPPHPVVRFWLWLSGAGPVLLAVVIGLGPAFRKMRSGPSGRAGIVRGSSDNHGHADWLSMRDARARFPGAHPTYGGVVVGEAYRVDEDTAARLAFDPQRRATWGRGGTAPLLIDPCERGPTHSLIFAGSGGFKSTCAVSTLLHWTGSAVVLDPSCELGPMLSATRKELEHRLVSLRLGGEEGFNALDWIDATAPAAESNVHAVIAWVFGETRPSDPGDEFFRARGKELAACLLAHILWDEEMPAEYKTLRTLRIGLSQPETQLRKQLKVVHRTSGSQMAREIAGSLMEVVDETFSGIVASANEGTAWLSVPAYASLVCGNSFQTAEIATGKLTVFIQCPLKALLVTPAVARVITGALLNALYEADGNVTGRVLFLLDEAYLLGPMKVLLQARDAGRKYGITLQLLYQSIGQAIEQWGRDGVRAWYDGCSWRGYAAIADTDTAKEVSAACGEFAVVAVSEGDNRGRQGKLGELGSRSKGSTANRHEIKRSLIKPDELLHDVREDELFVFARGVRPLRCGRAIYFRRPEIVSKVAPNRFAQQLQGVGV